MTRGEHVEARQMLTTIRRVTAPGGGPRAADQFRTRTSFPVASRLRSAISSAGVEFQSRGAPICGVSLPSATSNTRVARSWPNVSSPVR